MTAKSVPLVGVVCGASADLVATAAYADAALKEAYLANNAARATIAIEDGTELVGAGPTVLMLPGNCDVNPDWRSSQPCHN